MIRVNSNHSMSDTASVSSVSNGSIDSGPTRRERIPRTLQGVFLASNRGKDVHQPPPQQVASKTFFKNWLKGAFPWSRAARNARRDRKKQQKAHQEAATQAERTTVSEQDIAAVTQGLPAKIAIKSVVPKSKPGPLPISPQAYLDAMIRKRGYLTRRYKTLTTGYYSRPTELQKASYHIHLIGLARSEDAQGFRAVMEAGISPNPCNQHGESLVHTICRKGSHELLKIMLEAGTSVQVSDDYGRTPLHDACWGAKPSFETVKLLLERDLRLLHMTDARDAVPLSYVHKEDWKAWIEFLDAHKERFWPVRDVRGEGEQDDPPLATLEPDATPVSDPPNALPPSMAALVACGKMSPDEAALLRRDGEESDSENSDDDDDDVSEYDSDEDSGSEEGSDYDSDESEDWDEEGELAQLMKQLPTNSRMAQAAM